MESPIDTSTVERILRGDEAVEAGQGFTYDPAGRRDPFRSLLARQAKEEVGQRPPGLRGMGVEEIKLQGILKLPEGYVAMIQGTDNTSYLIRPGTVLYDGNVEHIEPGKVVFRMQVADPKSLKPYREVIRTLQ
jgi:Tfp pilus assembly protein PilP